ncbi:MAG: OsmC family protein (plasmid) [Nodularia sp. CChRGM 3473]
MTSVQVLSNESSLGQEVTIRQFHLIADEPPELGGDDTGPTPLEWVLAGLGSCKTMTVKMYAQRKGWSVEQVKVDLSYKKVSDRHQIQTHLFLKGNLNVDQQQRLLEIAARCPIHKLLTANLVIQTSLAPDESNEQKETTL